MQENDTSSLLLQISDDERLDFAKPLGRGTLGIGKKPKDQLGSLLDFRFLLGQRLPYSRRRKSRRRFSGITYSTFLEPIEPVFQPELAEVDLLGKFFQILRSPLSAQQIRSLSDKTFNYLVHTCTLISHFEKEHGADDTSLPASVIVSVRHLLWILLEHQRQLSELSPDDAWILHFGEDINDSDFEKVMRVSLNNDRDFQEGIINIKKMSRVHSEHLPPAISAPPPRVHFRHASQDPRIMLYARQGLMGRSMRRELVETASFLHLKHIRRELVDLFNNLTKKYPDWHIQLKLGDREIAFFMSRNAEIHQSSGLRECLTQFMRMFDSAASADEEQALMVLFKIIEMLQDATLFLPESEESDLSYNPLDFQLTQEQVEEIGSRLQAFINQYISEKIKKREAYRPHPMLLLMLLATLVSLVLYPHLGNTPRQIIHHMSEYGIEQTIESFESFIVGIIESESDDTEKTEDYLETPGLDRLTDGSPYNGPENNLLTFEQLKLLDEPNVEYRYLATKYGFDLYVPMDTAQFWFSANFPEKDEEQEQASPFAIHWSQIDFQYQPVEVQDRMQSPPGLHLQSWSADQLLSSFSVTNALSPQQFSAHPISDIFSSTAGRLILAPYESETDSNYFGLEGLHHGGFPTFEAYPLAIVSPSEATQPFSISIPAKFSAIAIITENQFVVDSNLVPYLGPVIQRTNYGMLRLTFLPNAHSGRVMVLGNAINISNQIGMEVNSLEQPVTEIDNTPFITLPPSERGVMDHANFVAANQENYEVPQEVVDFLQRASIIDLDELRARTQNIVVSDNSRYDLSRMQSIRAAVITEIYNEIIQMLKESGFKYSSDERINAVLSNGDVRTYFLAGKTVGLDCDGLSFVAMIIAQTYVQNYGTISVTIEESFNNPRQITQIILDPSDVGNSISLGEIRLQADNFMSGRVNHARPIVSGRYPASSATVESTTGFDVVQQASSEDINDLQIEFERELGYSPRFSGVEIPNLSVSSNLYISLTILVILGLSSVALSKMISGLFTSSHKRRDGTNNPSTSNLEKISDLYEQMMPKLLPLVIRSLKELSPHQVALLPEVITLVMRPEIYLPDDHTFSSITDRSNTIKLSLRNMRARGSKSGFDEATNPRKLIQLLISFDIYTTERKAAAIAIEEALKDPTIATDELKPVLLAVQQLLKLRFLQSYFN